MFNETNNSRFNSLLNQHINGAHHARNRTAITSAGYQSQYNGHHRRRSTMMKIIRKNKGPKSRSPEDNINGTK